MPMWTILSQWFSPSKSAVSPPAPTTPPTESQLADAFTRGYLLALEVGLPALEKTLVDKAATQMLAKLQATIEARATAAGAVRPREVLALQAKQTEFAEKFRTTNDVKYQHYLEALNWMLPTNGH